jgi:hypothetical protein
VTEPFGGEFTYHDPDEAPTFDVAVVDGRQFLAVDALLAFLNDDEANALFAPFTCPEGFKVLAGTLSQIVAAALDGAYEGDSK